MARGPSGPRSCRRVGALPIARLWLAAHSGSAGRGLRDWLHAAGLNCRTTAKVPPACRVTPDGPDPPSAYGCGWSAGPEYGFMAERHARCRLRGKKPGREQRVS